VDRVTKAELAAFKAEAAPILRHAAVLAILTTVAVVSDVLLFLLKITLPEYAPTFEFLERLDIIFFTGLFCLFGIYTAVLVVLRMWRSVRGELTSSQRARK
jgi:hypothetical protein